MDYKLIVLIIAINIVYVSISTLRMILVIKGKRIIAAIFSMAEVFIYLMGLSIVLKHLDNPINIIAYCIGFGIGVYSGSRIEEYLALGYVTVEVTVESMRQELPGQIREKGYGVTSWPAYGRDGQRLMMRMLAKRSNEKRLFELVKELAPNAFIVSYEPKNFRGGFWTKRLRQ